MSFEALAWAGKVDCGTPARKLVLFALADRHNPESGTAYPSVAWLCEWTHLNRKTVISALSYLETELNVISDSGERVGKTGQIKAYRLHISTVPKTEQSQKRNSSTFSRKESQKRDTEPVREPSSEDIHPPHSEKQGKNWHRLPEGWKPTKAFPPAVKAKVDTWPDGMLADTIADFKRWAANAPDQNGKGKKLDWDKALWNWIGRKHDDRQRFNGHGQGSRTTRAIQGLGELSDDRPF